MVDVIEGRVVHKTSNALQQAFKSGPGEPIATAVQSAGDGKGRKVGMLFGFINGGTGTHVLTYADGKHVHVHSRSSEPTLVTTPEGAEIVTIERGDTSVARTSSGGEVVEFTGDPDGVKSPEAFRMRIKAPDGTDLGRLDVIRTVAGWKLSDSIVDTIIWWDRAGAPLKVPFLGTRLEVTRPLSELERDTLFAACVDLAIGLRPYVAGMR
jgi:hypothetical protein